MLVAIIALFAHAVTGDVHEFSTDQISWQFNGGHSMQEVKGCAGIDVASMLVLENGASASTSLESDRAPA